MLQEVSEDELETMLADKESVIVFFYTPLCGTCKLANRMLEVVLEALKLPFKTAACDLNVMPNAAGNYKIMSVPCLMVFQNGELKEKIFRFQSIEYLYSSLAVYKDNLN